VLPFAIGLAFSGCAHRQTRLQAEDEADRAKEAKEAEIKTIGDDVSFANADPVPVSGIGLVVGLEGTGGGAPPGTLRHRLEDQLRKRGIEDVKGILASKDASPVLVTALVPPGARKGDSIDLEITLPRESKTTSLRSGRLLECELFNYDTTKNLNPKYAGADRYVMGHPIAKAEGPLLVGFGDGDEEGRLRQARIWGGGRCRIDRPLFVVLNIDKQSARLAQVIADRINQAFHGSVRGPMSDLAVAETKQVVYLRVPPQYRLNLPRYLRVVRLIPLQESEAAQRAYHQRLEEQLLDPAHTVMAALRLEALGQESVKTLKVGLNAESPLVRFCSAEALAYLGSPSCGEELARVVEQQPALRAFSLTALASLDEAVCHVELRRLLSSPSPETRYGAFRALRALDEYEEAVPGELLNEAFWLHQVAPHSAPLVHLSTVKRAEIVLFGKEASLIPPFPIVAGEFTVTAKQGDERCTITRISLHHGKNKRQCSFQLAEVLHTMADMGAGYAEVVEVLRRADALQCLNCRVAVDALPQATSVYDLAKAGAGDPELQRTHPEILAAKADFGATPTLFEQTGRRSNVSR
jgi:hypothetical protein